MTFDERHEERYRLGITGKQHKPLLAAKRVIKAKALPSAKRDHTPEQLAAMRLQQAKHKQGLKRYNKASR